MINEYFCLTCEHRWEIETEFAKPPKTPKKCPVCKKKTVGQQFTTFGVVNFLESARNFEHASDINKKRLGKEQLQLMEDADPIISKKKQRAKNLPWWQDGSVEGLPRDEKPLDLSTIKDVKKYIETGEKS